MGIWSALWILMPWCFSTRASVATLLSFHIYISHCLWVNKVWISSSIFVWVADDSVIENCCHYAWLTSPWYHMHIMASQITGRSTVCSTACSVNQWKNTRASYYCSFVREIHHSLTKGKGSPERALIWKGFMLCHLFKWNSMTENVSIKSLFLSFINFTIIQLRFK